jgi:hypothetical protein
VGRLIVLADVRLELDDPPDPPAGGVVPDESPAEERDPDLERGAVEDMPRVALLRGSDQLVRTAT